jgi:hypothetical protein
MVAPASAIAGVGIQRGYALRGVISVENQIARVQSQTLW